MRSFACCCGHSAPMATQGSSGDTFHGTCLTYSIQTSLLSTQLRQYAKLATYAVVDSGEAWAAPGPIWVHVAHNRWKSLVSFLIGRAAVIVIPVHPDQEVREGFRWELNEIALMRRRSRVILVLPPPNHETNTHERSCRRAAEVLNALGVGPEVLPDTCNRDLESWYIHLRRERALIVDVRVASEGTDSPLERPIVWTAHEDFWKRPDVALGASFYEENLVEILHGSEKLESVSPIRIAQTREVRRVRRRPHTVFGGDRENLRSPGGQGRKRAHFQSADRKTAPP
jgi:hypothetical protein